jgi:HEAT repeat protein
MAAVAALRALGKAAAPALERALVHDRRPVVRRWCAHLLGQISGRASACALLTGTHDRLAIVRLLCLQALVTRASQGEDLGVDLVPHIVRLARSDRSKRVRSAALEVLAARPRDARAAACLAAAAADSDLPAEVRQVCVSAAAATPLPTRPRAVVGWGF